MTPFGHKTQQPPAELPFLRISDLAVTRQDAPRPLLDRFSLLLEKGESVVLLGETGCGKEALIRVLAGHPGPGEHVSGTLSFADGLPHRAGSRLTHAPATAYLPGPDASPLSPNASVLSQLVRIIARRLNAPRASARAELELALGRMPGAPTLDMLDALPGRLEPHVIAWGLMAGVLAQTPALVLADHPLAGIAPRGARKLAMALKAEQQRLGFTLIYAATGIELARIFDTRTLILRHGRIVEEGTAQRLASDQAHSYTRTLFRGWMNEPRPSLQGRGEPVLQVSGLELPRVSTNPVPPQRRNHPARPSQDRLNFELRRGAGLALVGEQGSGRRALVRRLIGLERVRSGRIVLDAVDINILSGAMLTRLRRRIAYITGDDDALDPRMTIWDTVGEPLRAHLGMPRDMIAAHREAALKRVGLASLPGNCPVARLSAFDKRRLQVARAIVTTPLLAIVDEPLSGLDAFAQSVMCDLLRTFRGEEGPAFLLVTANFSVARALADNCLVLQDGQIIERGPVSEIVAAPKNIVTRALVEASGGVLPTAPTTTPTTSHRPKV